ncbi:MAG: DNA polymerase ligase N-terminal domain-containing protein [Thermoanaerobaculia bacterium]
MADRLKKYRSMRDFAQTAEPSGGKPKSRKPTFVIQKHQASHLHYDFRLEMEGVLKSWAVPKGPSFDPATKRLAMMTEDHPYDYGSFEGVIPAGNYGAGNVIIWDRGTWEFIEPGDDPVKALAAGKLTFRLKGKKLRGEWALVRIRGRSSRRNEWLLLKHDDEDADPDYDVTLEAPLSVVSKKGVDDIGGERVWRSNRSAMKRSSGPRTVADALREKKTARNPAAKSTRAKKSAAPAAARQRAKRSRSS